MTEVPRFYSAANLEEIFRRVGYEDVDNEKFHGIGCPSHNFLELLTAQRPEL